jgi:cell division septation protein DedD
VTTVRILVVLAVFVVAANAGAQTTAVTEDSATIVRARRLVSAGDGTAGRAAIDSMLARTPVTSAWYAEGLYWRGALSSNALDAERDYRRVAVEYPLSPRVPDALTRLAQLELARGERALARHHLERLLREVPPPSARASALYWLARINVEEGKRATGCRLVDSARVVAPPGDVELMNQIDAETRRCRAEPAVDAPTQTPSRAAASRAAAASATTNTVAAHTVQVGAWPQRASADRVRGQLAAKGFPARVVSTGTMWRVRVGRYAQRRDAERMAARLKAEKFPAWIVEAEAGR